MGLDLVVIDLDETLLRHDKTYDRAWFARIKEGLLRQSALIMIATGNSYHKVIDYFTDEERQDIYFATDNGNYIVKNEEDIYSTLIDKEIVLPALKYIENQEGWYSIVSDGQVTYFLQQKQDIMEKFRRFNNNTQVLDSYEDLPKGFRATKISISSEFDLEKNKGLAKQLGNHFPQTHIVTSGGGWLDMISNQGGKGRAVQYLEDKYAINRNQAMAFGDSLNDLSMMELVGFSVAMGNADPELVRSCKYQIGSNEDQAVLKVLDQYLQDSRLDYMQEYLIK